MKKKRPKGSGFRRLFPGSDLDEVETAEDMAAKYGEYLDENGVPLKGINPKPKYYVVPKEPKKFEERPPVKVVVRKRAKPEPAPKKAKVRKVKQDTVNIKEKSKS